MSSAESLIYAGKDSNKKTRTPIIIFCSIDASMDGKKKVDNRPIDDIRDDQVDHLPILIKPRMEQDAEIQAVLKKLIFFAANVIFTHA
ncbi:hypothetical protein JTB14_034849 [Gonioctena quinquepunctata]|nr:hypothetical protein JTB14_034849 [Gonioctena quinquepunctata]